MTGNALGRETSPYLLQHKDNPVHWQPWGPAALETAAREDKPILLSVGYAACHWCHVMAHESFEDLGIAELMNELYVNIKVDREERPDIDTIYQTALALTGQQGGWPLTMFLSPDGEPFWGGTYFPPTSRFGRPGFADVLRRVHEIYKGDREAVDQNRAAIREALGNVFKPGDPGAAPALSRELLDQVAERLDKEIDRTHGGVGGAPKFPHVPVFELLWRAFLRSGDERYREAVTLTLERMSQGGIYDHLGGGFARYSTDDHWLAPHFEKMLYDNSQMIDILCLAWQHERNPLYAARVAETAEWVLREMVADGGGFAATQDADSEGEEGRFYVWDEAEIDKLLPERKTLFKISYDVHSSGNWEGKTILNRSARPELGDAEHEAALAEARTTLFEAREHRIKPGWDDKVLADWNGLMITALANAAAIFAEPRWLAAAERAFAFVRDKMTVDGRLRHSFRGGEARHAALLDDYATMARAGLALYEATGQAPYLAQAEAWVADVDTHYSDREHGGYYYTADDAEALIVRTRNANDNAVPAGNGVMAGVLGRLYHLSGNEAYRERAEAVVAAFAGDLGRNFFPLATLLNSYEFLEAAVQVVIAGERDEPATDSLLRAAYQVSLPDRVVLVVGPEESLPAGHPAHGKGQVDDTATAYVCIGTTCSLPATDPEALVSALPRPPAQN
jgi:uncharacterized protein YyaL (SSP411 family)